MAYTQTYTLFHAREKRLERISIQWQYGIFKPAPKITHFATIKIDAEQLITSPILKVYKTIKMMSGKTDGMCYA